MISTPAASVHFAPESAHLQATWSAVKQRRARLALVQGSNGAVRGLLHADDVEWFARQAPNARLGDFPLRQVVELAHTATVADLDMAMKDPDVEAVLLRNGADLIAVFMRVTPGTVLERLTRMPSDRRPLRRAA